MTLNQKGEGRSGWIVGTLVLLTFFYVGWKVVPLMIRMYSFEDKVKEECKFLHGRTLEDLEVDLVKAAKLEKLPVTEENIELDRLFTGTYHVLRVNIAYTVPVTTPVKVFSWNRKVDYEAPIFE